MFTFFHIIYENTYVYVNLSSKDILKLNFKWISTDFSFHFITFYPLLIFLNSLYARIKSLFSLFMAKVQLYAKTLYIKFAFSNEARINHELIFLLCEKGKLICFLLKLFLGKYFFLTNTCYLFFFCIWKINIDNKRIPKLRLTVWIGLAPGPWKILELRSLRLLTYKFFFCHKLMSEISCKWNSGETILRKP